MADEKDKKDAREPEKVTMEEWSKRCAFAVLTDTDGVPFVVSNPRLVDAKVIYGALVQEVAMLQAVLNAQVMLNSMEELRRQTELRRNLAIPNGSPVKGMKR